MSVRYIDMSVRLRPQTSSHAGVVEIPLTNYHHSQVWVSYISIVLKHTNKNELPPLAVCNLLNYIFINKCA